MIRMRCRAEKQKRKGETRAPCYDAIYLCQWDGHMKNQAFVPHVFSHVCLPFSLSLFLSFFCYLGIFFDFVCCLRFGAESRLRCPFGFGLVAVRWFRYHARVWDMSSVQKNQWKQNMASCLISQKVTVFFLSVPFLVFILLPSSCSFFSSLFFFLNFLHFAQLLLFLARGIFRQATRGVFLSLSLFCLSFSIFLWIGVCVLMTQSEQIPFLFFVLLSLLSYSANIFYCFSLLSWFFMNLFVVCHSIPSTLLSVL